MTTPMSLYRMTLFCAGDSHATRRARDNLQHFCECELGGNCLLDFIDILVQPALALERKVLVTPTLILDEPKPERRLIGDLSDLRRLRAGLGL